ncbi:hypothetical protein HCI99_04680 [Listeria booriae]|uniref:Uncharacterized protein n=1 Tax=Listeria booriae TaxID=1552123 RepID=A0A7X0XBC3_9LIST|nr:hypothetical protein [Listeria booriae]MBC1490972.1 hypothetical protein [Listeria booriae]MBC1491113.1 hypothetical protein [Listeria booriae]
MTVLELIEQLKELPEDLPVGVSVGGVKLWTKAEKVKTVEITNAGITLALIEAGSDEE